MNKLSFFSQLSNLDIDKPYIYDIFFPMEHDNFILLDTVGPSGKYRNWQLVIGVVNNYLNKLNLPVYNNCSTHEKAIASTRQLSGALFANQLSYMIKRAKILITTNPLSFQIASSLDKPCVFVCSEKLFKLYKPSYSKLKRLKIIKDDDGAKPEEIAAAILSFFNIDLKIGFETVYVGNKNRDGQEFIEGVPNQIFKGEGLSGVGVRMDLHFNEHNLVHQLSASSVSIVTNKRINLDILKNFKSKIPNLVYFIEENDDPSFCDEVQKIGLNLILYSNLPDAELQKKKINYMDFSLIKTLDKINIKDNKRFDGLDFSKLYFLSNRFILSESKVYPSEESWRQNAPTSSKTQINPIINNDSFWNEIENFWILKKKD